VSTDVEISVEQEPEVAQSRPAIHGTIDLQQLNSETLDEHAGLSPLERWRNSRPLAVSDFTSPAWCELQYFFSLSKYGRIQRTAPMKRGSEVHRKLEEEIHEYKPVEVQTKEDSWGLRIWNVIQSLRTLRYMGVTRELDVWGVVDGQVVAGVIDELSIQCPDPELEEKLEEKENPASPLPSGQQTITEFFAERSASQQAKQSLPQDLPAKIYITDTKTRTTPTVPNGSSLRPVKIQLMMYHNLIMQLSSKKVPSAPIFERYKLRPSAPFSEIFMAEMSAVEFNISAQVSHFSSPSSLHNELQSHPNLESLWNLMLSEFAETFQPGALSPLLHASFRSQADGALLGGRSFVNDGSELQTYLSNEMDWWKGVRPARGVEVNEAFKCRICEFAEGCEWRKEKEKEMTTGRGIRGRGKARER
jgi:exonuclease V